MVNWLLDNRFIGSIIPPLHLEWRDFALLVLRTQSFLYGWWDCVAMCSRLCKVAEESLFHVCCAENESRRGCELHQSTKAPKHQRTGRQCSSAAGQRSPEQGSAERVLSSQESSPPFLFLPSNSCWARSWSAQSLRIKNQPQHLLRWELSAYCSLPQVPQPESLSSFSFSFFLTLAALEGRILIEIRKIGEAWSWDDLKAGYHQDLPCRLQEMDFVDQNLEIKLRSEIVLANNRGTIDIGDVS